MSNAQRASLSKKEKASAVRRKRKEDPNPERQGEPINVKSKVNENMEQLDEKNKPTNPELWSRAIAQAKSKFDVYPSAYANGWAAKWYKEKGGGWKSVAEAAEVGDDPINQGTPEGLTRRGPKTMLKKFKELSMEGAVPSTEKVVTVKHKTSGKELVVTPEKAKQLKPQGYHPVKEDVEQIDEKNVPTSPEKWSQAKAQAKAKFDVYPSAYANGWAAKKYKEMGGGWKSVSEAKEEKPPFDPDPPRKQQVVAGKYGVGYSTARHLARMAMQKQSDKMKKPIKEEEMSSGYDTLKKWSGFPLPHRCKLFHYTWTDKRITPQSLSKLYRKNGIRLKAVRLFKLPPNYSMEKCIRLVNEVKERLKDAKS
jgi:hypothetical protein